MKLHLYENCLVAKKTFLVGLEIRSRAGYKLSRWLKDAVTSRQMARSPVMGTGRFSLY
jgi:hypothetical protein